MIAELLPLAVVAVESFGEPEDAALLPGEAATIATAGRKRRAEFGAGRAVAHAALRELGIPAGPVLPGRAGEPLWPAGVVGSLTHCAGYRACAVARDTDLAAIGIDAEPSRALPDRVLTAVAGDEERSRIAELSAASPGVPWDLLLFCAKESVYKAWSGAIGRGGGVSASRAPGGVSASRALRLRFADVRAEFAEAGRFTAHVAGAAARIDGRWLVRDGLALTAVTLPAGRTSDDRRHAGSAGVLTTPGGKQR